MIVASISVFPIRTSPPLMSVGDGAIFREPNPIDDVFGLDNNGIPYGRLTDFAEEAALGRVAAAAKTVRRFGESRFARPWMIERRVIAQGEAPA